MLPCFKQLHASGIKVKVVPWSWTILKVPNLQGENIHFPKPDLFSTDTAFSLDFNKPIELLVNEIDLQFEKYESLFSQGNQKRKIRIAIKTKIKIKTKIMLITRVKLTFLKRLKF